VHQIEEYVKKPKGKREKSQRPAWDEAKKNGTAWRDLPELTSERLEALEMQFHVVADSLRRHAVGQNDLRSNAYKRIYILEYIADEIFTRLNLIKGDDNV